MGNQYFVAQGVPKIWGDTEMRPVENLHEAFGLAATERWENGRPAEIDDAGNVISVRHWNSVAGWITPDADNL